MGEPQQRGAAASPGGESPAARAEMILTPDQRVRVFISSTLEELAAERAAARRAIRRLHLVPVWYESGARPHPPRSMYQAYLEQSQVFVGSTGSGTPGWRGLARPRCRFADLSCCPSAAARWQAVVRPDEDDLRAATRVFGLTIRRPESAIGSCGPRGVSRCVIGLRSSRRAHA